MDIDRRVEAVSAIWSAIDAMLDWDELHLAGVDAACPAMLLLCDLAGQQCQHHVLGDEMRDRVLEIDIDGSFDAFKTRLTEQGKRALLGERARAERDWPATLEYADASNYDEYLAHLESSPGVNAHAQTMGLAQMQFYRDICRIYSARDELRLSRLVVNGAVASTLLNLVDDGIEYCIRYGGHDEQASSGGAWAAIHTGMVLERAFSERRTRAFAFMPGDISRAWFDAGYSVRVRQLRTARFVRTRGSVRSIWKRVARPDRKFDRQVLAVVVGAHSVTGYHTAIALAKAGVGVIGIADHDAPSEFRHSRFWLEYQHNGYSAGEILGALERISAEYPNRRLAVFPCDDYSVELLSERRDELSRFAAWLAPDPDPLRRMMHKDLFYEWAPKAGLRVPRSLSLAAEDLTEAQLGVMPRPFIVKPSVRDARWNSAFPTEKFIFFGDQPAEPVDLGQLRTLADRFVVQEWIPGADDDIYFGLCFFDDLGNCRAAVGGRKLSQWPQAMGNTAVCITECDLELLDLTRETLTKAGLVGIGSVEFKRNRDTGEYVIIEPTVGRSDHQSLLALKSCVNIPVMALRCMLQEPPGWELPGRKALWIDDLALVRLFRKVGARSVASMLPLRRVSALSLARIRFSDAGVALRFLSALVRRQFRRGRIEDA